MAKLFPVTIRHRPPRLRQDTIEATQETVLDVFAKHDGDMSYSTRTRRDPSCPQRIVREPSLRDADVLAPLWKFTA